MKRYSIKTIQNTHFFTVLFSSATKKGIKFLSFSALLLLLSLLISSNSAWAQTGVIGDKVWNDANQNGIQDTGEPGISGVQVDLEAYIGPPSPTPSQLADPANWSTSSTTPATVVTTTNGAGSYSFTGLVSRYYRVKFYLPAGYNFSPQNAPYPPRPALSFAYDSDAGASGYTQAIFLETGQTNNTIDAGMFIPAPMPVKLTKFDITKEGNNLAILTWTTTEELNSSYFEIQKSTDAKSWIEVAKVYAKGNHMGLANYQHIDNGPYAGTNYYRLKMVDTDGTFGYSSIRAVTFDGAKIVHIVSYPNPASEQIFITNALGYNIVDVKILDLSGRIRLIKKPFQPATGIDVKSLPEGIYMMSISLENGSTERQRVLIKR